jgi:Tol biopolymer transport system component
MKLFNNLCKNASYMLAVTGCLVVDVMQPALALPLFEPGTIERVSVSSLGQEAKDENENAVISANGRYVAFVSRASNLVPNDNNGNLGGDIYSGSDVFIRDLKTKTTERVSINNQGIEGNNASSNYVAISSDGRYVAFTSYASNLVDNDTNAIPGNWYSGLDVFVRDRLLGKTKRVSLDNAGNQITHTYYEKISMSANGRYITFSSDEDKIVPDDNDGGLDIFVRDQFKNRTYRVSENSLNNGGCQCTDGTISPNGRYIAFSSRARNFIHGLNDPQGENNLPLEIVYVRDLKKGALKVGSVVDQQVGQGRDPVLSWNGRYLAWSDYPNVYIRDIFKRKTKVVSVNAKSEAGNMQSFQPSISYSGRYVAFWSYADNLVLNDFNGATLASSGADVFVRDLVADKIIRVSVNNNGEEGNNFSGAVVSISRSGKRVLFASTADNLDDKDTNADRVYYDLFVNYLK